jgi:hypothetical protein
VERAPRLRPFPTWPAGGRLRAGSFASFAGKPARHPFGARFKPPFPCPSACVRYYQATEKNKNMAVREADMVSALSGLSAWIYRKTAPAISFFNIID